MNRRISLKTVSPGSIDWDAAVLYESAGTSSTHVVNTGTIHLRGPWKIMEPLISGEVKRSETKELTKLKNLLESEIKVS